VSEEKKGYHNFEIKHVCAQLFLSAVELNWGDVCYVQCINICACIIISKTSYKFWIPGNLVINLISLIWKNVILGKNKLDKKWFCRIGFEIILSN